IGRNWSKNSPVLPPPGQARPSVFELHAPTFNHVSRRSLIEGGSRCIADMSKNRRKGRFFSGGVLCTLNLIATIRIVNRKIRLARSGGRSSWRRDLRYGIRKETEHC